jgi:hypothetical protein
MPRLLLALRLIEPALVQVLFSGIGPLSVLWIENRFSATDARTAIWHAETVVAAAALEWLSPAELQPASLSLDVPLLLSLLLIMVASYVNQLAISLASPLTIRVVLASGPVLIFLFQLIEGRLSASPYILAAALLYATPPIAAGAVRRRAIRTKVLCE